MLYSETLEINLYLMVFQERFAVISFPNPKWVPTSRTGGECRDLSHSALTQEKEESNFGIGEKSLAPSTAPGTGDERPDP